MTHLNYPIGVLIMAYGGPNSLEELPGYLSDIRAGRPTGLNPLGSETGGYFWYSDQTADAIAVHNTSALIAMASDIYGELVGDSSYQLRAASCARLLHARLEVTPSGGYTWNYADDGYPESLRRPEDVSHALVTTQLMRYAATAAGGRPRTWRSSPSPSASRSGPTTRRG